MSLVSGDLSVAPFSLWVAFSIAVLFCIAVDLALFHRKEKAVSVRVALLESSIWIGLALTFNAWFWHRYGAVLGMEFLTGYLIEKSLSVDNLFVMLLIFSSFRVPAAYQHRVLYYGILGAIVMRGTLILLGAELLHRFHWILYFFGVVLLVTAFKFLSGSDRRIDASESRSVRLLRRLIPISSKANGSRFFIRENGRIRGTPLFLALLVIEISDLIFAVDSIPAVFAVTQDAFVAFASNILAILGLRALYFAMAGAVSRLRYLKPGLAVILGFIGVKLLLNEVFEIPGWVSLLVIASVLLTAGLSSWYVASFRRKHARPAPMPR